MNRNAFIGIALVITAGVLAYLVASVSDSAAVGLVGKAAWYLPYVALVCGVRRLVRARS